VVDVGYKKVGKKSRRGKRRHKLAQHKGHRSNKTRSGIPRMKRVEYLRRKQALREEEG
jgi:hypothetical protein